MSPKESNIENWQTVKKSRNQKSTISLEKEGNYYNIYGRWYMITSNTAFTSGVSHLRCIIGNCFFVISRIESCARQNFNSMHQPLCKYFSMLVRHRINGNWKNSDDFEIITIYNFFRTSYKWRLIMMMRKCVFNLCIYLLLFQSNQSFLFKTDSLRSITATFTISTKNCYFYYLLKKRNHNCRWIKRSITLANGLLKCSLWSFWNE